jgi:hypothetical protein
MKARCTVRRLIVLAAAVLACGCTSSVDREPAQAAVREFHARLDAGRFDAIWEASSPALQAGSPHARFVTLLGVIHAKLGATQSATEKRWNLERRLSDALLTLDYATVYAGGAADESFVYRMAGDRAELVEYRIHAQALGPDAPAP